MDAEDHNYPTWKGYLFRLQQEAPKPNPVLCQRSEVTSNRPSYYGNEYHGLISRDEGELLCPEEGDYLIRESQTERGRYTLVLRVLNSVKNFKLYYENGKHFVGEKKFNSVFSLAEDGLITLYVESKAQDYINRMSNEPVYNSLSRYSSLGGKQGAVHHPYLQYPKPPSPTDVDEQMHCYQQPHNINASHLQPASEGTLNCHLGSVLPDVCSFLPESNPHHTSREVYPIYQEECMRRNDTFLAQTHLIAETAGRLKKSLTPTSSDERKKNKKRIATEEHVLHQENSIYDEREHFLLREQEELYRALAAAAPVDADAASNTMNLRRISYDRYGNERNEMKQSLCRRVSTDAAVSPVKQSQYHRPTIAHKHLSTVAHVRHLGAAQNFAQRSQPLPDTGFSSSFNAGIRDSRGLDHLNNPYCLPQHSGALPRLDEATSLDHLLVIHRKLEEESRYCDVAHAGSSFHIRQRSAPEKLMYHPADKSSREQLENGILRSNRVTDERFLRHNKVTNTNHVPVRRTESIDSCGSEVSNSSSGVERYPCNYAPESYHFSSEDERGSPSPRHRPSILQRLNNISPKPQYLPARESKMGHPIQEESPWEYRKDVELQSCNNPHSSSANILPDSLEAFGNELKSVQEDEKRLREEAGETNQNSAMHKIGQSEQRKPLVRRATTNEISPRKNEQSLLKTSHSVKERSNKKQIDDSKHHSPSLSTKSKNCQPHTSSPTSRRKSGRKKGGAAHHYEKEHHFKSHTYRGLQWCEYCGNFMWGIIQQGMQCLDCGLNVHKQCTKLVPRDCQPALKHIKHVYGTDLTTLVKIHGTKRPLVVDKCVEEIEKRGMDSLGIYRVSGFHDDVMELKGEFDESGSGAELSCHEDINIIAGALKLYLRELPVPLIPYQLYSRFINAAKISHENGKLDAVRMGLSAMPGAHLQTLKYLIQHLGRVSERSFLNQMCADNLGVVFGPTLLRTPEKDFQFIMNDTLYQQQAVATLIEYRHYLFGEG